MSVFLLFFTAVVTQTQDNLPQNKWFRMNPAVIGATAKPTEGISPTKGTDLRLFSAGSIGSVEVIRGIPSAQYGDPTSGAVILHSKAGLQPLQVLFDFRRKQFI
ncbi:MAG: hypothetical protein AB2L20_28080 [Mangrovibacterium sp.]